MTPFATPLAATSLTATQPAVPLFSTTPVPVQDQRATNWCWLATTASVDALHGGATQCGLANTLLNQQACCLRPKSVACDKAGSVDVALNLVGRLASTNPLAAPPAGTLIDSELLSGRPPIAQIAFSGGGNHVVVLAARGYDASGAEIVRVGDPAPAYNPTDVTWSNAAQYRGGVTWTDVCWTT